MKTLTYNEIYYSSSERSIITNSAGFGVRTYTSGMNPQEVSEIAQKCVEGYGVNFDRMLSFEKIQQNPKIVYDYTPTFLFRKVTLNSGVTKYVLGRTIYLGIDYGYFCNKPGYMRTGTNYFTHLIVFGEFPPISILAQIEQKGFFSPIDYTCTPDNAELQFLLTGTPQFLSQKTIQCNDTCGCNVDEELAYCIIGLLQSAYNTANNKDDNLRKIVIKAPAAKTPELIKKLSLMPSALMEKRAFMTNYTHGNGVPDDFDIVFVNEFNTNEIYENIHICVDLFNKTTTNVDDNFIYKKILELSVQNDSVTIQKLISYYLNLNLTKNLDYQFMYSLFIAVESDKNLTLDDISQDFINKLSDVRLTQPQESELWRKINYVINSGLTSTSGLEMINTINALGYILPTYRNNVQITQESSNCVAIAIFGDAPHLSAIVKTSNIDTIINIIGRLDKTPEAFFNALSQTPDIVIWRKFINFYYAENSNNLLSNIDFIVENILSSKISKSEKEELIKQLYPTDKCLNELFSYILKHISQITQLPEIAKVVCQNSPERISLIIKQSNNDPSIIRFVAPFVLAYYEKLIDENCNFGMNVLLSFVDSVSAEIFNMMGLTNLFAKYINKCMEKPTEDTKAILPRILSSNIKTDKQTHEQIVVLKNLFDNEIPQNVDKDTMLTANKMKKAEDYILALYEVWLKSHPSFDELRFYIKKSKNLSPTMIGGLITATWKSKVQIIQKERKKYVLTILDNTNWGKQDKQAFLSSCEDKNLVSFLNESNKPIKKIIRLILNIFKK